MIQVCPKKERDFPDPILFWGWDVSTINPTRSGVVWILRVSCLSCPVFVCKLCKHCCVEFRMDVSGQLTMIPKPELKAFCW